MGILSSLFQTGAPTQQVAGPTMATSKLPEELAPYYKDILGKSSSTFIMKELVKVINLIKVLRLQTLHLNNNKLLQD